MAQTAAPNEPVTASADAEPVASSHQRIVAIDALRGFDMFWIAGGSELLQAFAGTFSNPIPKALKDQLEHTKWDGFTAWDLIMPLFLFVVGAAMPFSFSRRLDQGSTWGLYLKILRRTLILFVLGMAVQGHLLDFNLKTYHFFSNTLQAIAVGYFVSAMVMLNVGIVGQAIFTALMLIGYWLLLRFYPLEGVGTGSFEPYANVAYSVDKYVFGRFIDQTKPPYTWALSGMGFAGTTMLGVFSGHVLRSKISPWGRAGVLTLLGALCLAAGWGWAWAGFPWIKHIWTSSMALWAAGWCYLLLALFYVVFDIFSLRRLAFPLVVIGMNAIVIYVAWHFIPFKGIAENLVGVEAASRKSATGLVALCGPSIGPFILAFATVALWWLILYHFYRRKIFVRI